MFLGVDGGSQNSSCSFSIGRFCLEEEKVGWHADGGWFRQQPFNMGEQLVQYPSFLLQRQDLQAPVEQVQQRFFFDIRRRRG